MPPLVVNFSDWLKSVPVARLLSAVAVAGISWIAFLFAPERWRTILLFSPDFKIPLSVIIIFCPFWRF